jgi:LPS O-antigen subunit length determinant protein (WzzB/FepE family)
MNRKIFEWLKLNWLKIVILVAIGLALWQLYVSSETHEIMYKENMKQSELFHKQLKELEVVNQQLKIRQDILENTYKVELDTIKKEYDQKIVDLANMKKNNELKIIKEAKEKPETLTTKIENMFGIPVEKR